MTWVLGHKPEWRPHDELRRALTDDDPQVRANAIRALARLGDATPAAALENDPDPRVRAAARHARVG
jgi:HEAT repeat protein